MSALDLLLVNANSRGPVYGALSDLAAIEPPVWAGLIARYCRDRGFTVAILDAEAEGLSAEETAQRIQDAAPRLAAFCIYGHQPSASTQCMPASIVTARMVAGKVPTLALGTHPSALPQRTLAEGFDFVVQGEGPLTIAAMLANAFIPKPGTVWSIPGLWGNALPPWGTMTNIADLDAELPAQPWDLLDMRRYRAHNWHRWSGNADGGYASVQTSLGCPYACHFCCINAPFGGRGYRTWGQRNIADQLFTLIDQHGIGNVKIPDEMFVLNKAHVEGVCNEIIKWNIGDYLNLWAYARIDTVKDEKLLTIMRRAGFRWLGIGIESGSKHVRDGVEKGRFGDDDIERAVARVRSAGIHVGANYIFGLPDDTHESMQATLDMACSLNTEWANFYCAMCYPGSALHAEAGRRGWKRPEDPGGPGWIGYSQHAPESLPLPTETLSADEVLDFRDDAFLAYFSRPGYKALIERTFGPSALAEVDRMLALGKPKRNHRKDAP